LASAQMIIAIRGVLSTDPFPGDILGFAGRRVIASELPQGWQGAGLPRRRPIVNI
jgi:hypothetical protein